MKSVIKLKNILNLYYKCFFKSKRNNIAWCTSMGPSEILISMGFKVYYPENNGAFIGAYRLSRKYINISNSIGYSNEICSYLTSDIGAYIYKEFPLARAYSIKSLPVPDILVYNTNQCREVQDWFNFYSVEFSCEIFGLNSPNKLNNLTYDHVICISEQFKKFIIFLKENFFIDFKVSSLKKVLFLSKKTSLLWEKILNISKKNPLSLNFFDSCIYMAPAVLLRGLNIANSYYNFLYKELKKDKIKSSKKLRFLWEGMPVWGKLRFLSNSFENFNSYVIASTYCSSWILNFSEKLDLFSSMSNAYTKIFINRSEDYKEKFLISMINFFNIDGVIFHNSKTCSNNSNSRFGLPSRLIKKGFDILVFDGDLNDLSYFSEDQFLTSIEAFVDQVKIKKFK